MRRAATGIATPCDAATTDRLLGNRARQFGIWAQLGNVGRNSGVPIGPREPTVTVWLAKTVGPFGQAVSGGRGRVQVILRGRADRQVAPQRRETGSRRAWRTRAPGAAGREGGAGKVGPGLGGSPRTRAVCLQIDPPEPGGRPLNSSFR